MSQRGGGTDAAAIVLMAKQTAAIVLMAKQTPAAGRTAVMAGTSPAAAKYVVFA